MLVLSENTMQLVLFRFQDDDEMLINAVLLPECSIWGTSSILEKVIFGILMCIVEFSECVMLFSILVIFIDYFLPNELEH